MKIIYFILTASIIKLICSCNHSQQQTATAIQNTVAHFVLSKKAAANKAMVKTTSNGKLIAEYTCPVPGAARMPESGSASRMLNLYSPDNKYSLLGTFATAASDKYPLADDSKAKAPDTIIYPDGISMPPRLVVDKGQIEIALTGKTCSGRFMGSKKRFDGKEYVISGQFSNIPLIRQNSEETY